jgi:transcriptional coactivator HFI1/ADA1
MYSRLLCIHWLTIEIGKRNQAELAWIVDPFLRGEPQRESLHNQLIMALFANTQREPPDMPGVASWVAANDKPTAAAKPVTGDAAELRLKTEVMQLSARERHRMKNLQEVR